MFRFTPLWVHTKGVHRALPRREDDKTVALILPPPNRFSLRSLERKQNRTEDLPKSALKKGGDARSNVLVAKTTPVAFDLPTQWITVIVERP